MYKVTLNKVSKKFTVECYYFDTSKVCNRLVWTAHNLEHAGVARLVKDKLRSDDDIDMMFTILNETLSPAYLNDTGHIVPVSVSKGVKGEKNETIDRRKTATTILPRTAGGTN